MQNLQDILEKIFGAQPLSPWNAARMAHIEKFKDNHSVIQRALVEARAENSLPKIVALNFAVLIKVSSTKELLQDMMKTDFEKGSQLLDNLQGCALGICPGMDEHMPWAVKLAQEDRIAFHAYMAEWRKENPEPRETPLQ
jgi:hypothetical protein